MKNIIELKVYAEQVQLLYKAFMTSVAATFIAATLLVYSLWEITEHKLLLGWWLVIAVVTLSRAYLAYLYQRKTPNINESQHWGTLFITGAMIAGITWGCGSVLLFPENSSTHQILIVAVLIGICSGAVTSLSVVRKAVLFFIIPAILPATLLFFIEESTLSNIVAVMVLLAFLFFLKGANNIYRFTQENIHLRLNAQENEQDQYKAEEFQRTLLNASPDTIYVLDRKGIIARVNRVSSGEHENDVIGQNIFQYIHADTRHSFEKAFQQVIDSKELKSIETIEQHPDGLHYFFCRLNPVQIGDDFIVVLISTDITERKQNEKDLIKARDEATLANQAKSGFISKMSHELRTPLNAILGFSQLLNLSLKTEDEKNQVGQILIAGQHLLDLINEILDLSKIESGKEELELQNCSLNSIIEKSFSLIETIAQSSEIQLIDKISEISNYNVYVDDKRFKQVMLNLLSNAIKYNKAHGSVTLSCEVIDDKSLRIKVTDTGAGLSEQQQQSLFKPFERLQEHEHIEGTGIGLMISKQLIEKMGGMIGVESEPEKGSTFWVQVDLSKRNAQQTQITKSETTSIEKKSGAAKKILYIDDNLNNIEIVSNIVELKTSHLLLTATDASEGLMLALEQQPDLILTDINMPVMNGYELLVELQKNKNMQHVPVVAVSANAMPVDIEKALSAGFHSYVCKPFTINVMVESINKALEINKG